MKVNYSSRFQKQYRKLSTKVQVRVKEKIALLIKDEHHISLRNHKLHGEYVAYRSIDVTGDVWMIYRRTEEGIFFLQSVGTHNQLYD